MRSCESRSLAVVLVIVSLGAHPQRVWAESFTATGPMIFARSGHQATVLLDGRVLVSGGSDATGIGVAQAEIFSPVTGTWSGTGTNIIPRLEHTAALLTDGRVLVVGGAPSSSGCTTNATAETYDPVTGAWSSAADLPFIAGSGPIALRMSDGRVLVTGGGNRCGQAFDTAAVFDPSRNTWAATAGMTMPRAFHSAILLTDGRVLVTGGTTTDGDSSISAELYDPAAATWTAVGDSGPPRGTSCDGSLQTFMSRFEHGSLLVAQATPATCSSLTLLSRGQVLVAGGSSASEPARPAAELFDPAAGRRTLVGPLRTPRAGHTATRLLNGSVLIAGGNDAAGRTSAAEIFIQEIAYARGGFVMPRGVYDRTGDHFWGRYQAVANNSKNRIFVSYVMGEREIIEWDPRPGPWRERHILDIGSGLGPFHSVRIDKEDNIWVVSDSTSEVIEFDPAGRVLLRFGGRPRRSDSAQEPPVSDTSSPGPQYLDHPTDLALDQAGNVFVCDTGHSRIVKFDRSGRFVRTVGSRGSEPGQMKTPHSIAADVNGHVYVADGGNARIQVFDNNLNLLAIYDTVGSPWALCITQGTYQYLYTSSNPDQTDVTRGRSTGEILELELDGTIVGKIGRGDNALGNFRTLHVIDCRQDDEILAAEFGDGAHAIKLRP